MSNIKHIILGEDDIDDQEILKEVFTTVDNTFQINFFSNGKQIINHLEQVGDHQLPCLIVLDYNMPELNGAEILKVLSSYNKLSHIPKIIWSTSSAPTYKSMCLNLGASDYLVKPSRMHLLEETVRHMLSFCK
jgi:CheY-like chemotaxis protein